MQEQKPLIRHKIVDSNEPSIIRQKLLELGWEQKQLYSADYWFFTGDYKKIGIERKTVSDLMGSLGDRLSRQLENMLDHFDISILLLEGSWKAVAGKVVSNRGIEFYTWDLVWNYIRRFQDRGITIELTSNEGHTIKRLNAIYALYQKAYSLSSKSKQFTDDRLLALPSGTRGTTGQKVLAKFGSLRDIALASREQLLEVEKIGPKKADLIFQHFNRSANNESK